MHKRLIKNFRGFKILRTREHSIVALLAVVVGIGGGLGVVGFRYLMGLFQSLAYGSSAELLDLAKSIPWYLRMAIPALGGLIIGPIVYFTGKEAKGYGVPEVMESVALRSGYIRKRVLVIKSLTSAICIGTGGSVGSVGPIVQIGSAVGSFVGQVIKISVDRMRTLVGCGAAASIAAIFDAPLAGSMFAIEIMLGDFGLATFSPIIISSVTATAVYRHFLGGSPLLTIPAFQVSSLWELPLYVVLGVFCAFTALLFVKTLHRSEDFFDDLRFPEYLKAGIGGLALGVIGLLSPYILGVGFGVIQLTLLQQLPWMLMLALIFFKIGATAISLGSGGSGGIFAPCLYMGAMAGGFFGGIVNHMAPDITASAVSYGIVGMAAVVGAAIHGPFTAILLLFEMTGDYHVILPVTIACITSSFVIGKAMKESIYTLKLLRRGIDIRAGRDVNILKSIPVKDVMSLKVETIGEGLKLPEIFERISKSKYNNFPMLDQEGKLTGVLYYNDYRDVIRDENSDEDMVTEDLATPMDVSISTEDNLYDALELITHQDVSILPIVSATDASELKGILTYHDIINAYNLSAKKRSLFTDKNYDTKLR